MIYLRHPVHGTKVATMELEAQADEQNGWKRFDHNQPTPDAVEEPVNALEPRRRRKVPVEQQEED